MKGTECSACTTNKLEMESTDEVWVPVRDFENYEVSNYGSVYNSRMKRDLLPRLTNLGYLIVRLYNKRGHKDAFVHRLVAEGFMGDFRPELQIGHYDEDNTNNHIDNLRIRGGNRFSVNRYEAKNRGGGKVLILETGDVFLNAYSAARHLGTDANSIYRCLRKERKRHLGLTFVRYEEDENE